jgi:metal-responsive CopG/Arc/MetJ family transcriptional regulator
MRPPIKDVHVRLQDELLRAINDFRRDEADVPSMSETMRRLLRFAITARQETAASKQGA